MELGRSGQPIVKRTLPIGILAGQRLRLCQTPSTSIPDQGADRSKSAGRPDTSTFSGPRLVVVFPPAPTCTLDFRGSRASVTPGNSTGLATGAPMAWAMRRSVAGRISRTLSTTRAVPRRTTPDSETTCNARSDRYEVAKMDAHGRERQSCLASSATRPSATLTRPGAAEQGDDCRASRITPRAALVG